MITDSCSTKLTIDDAKSGNLISIVYEFNNNGTTSLFTGDNVGTLIQRSIEQKAPKVHALYDILKVSSQRVYIPSNNTHR